MPTELKPCPFCGGHAILCKEHETHELGYEIKTALVKCDCCGANTGAYYVNGVYDTTTTVQDVINAWNRRDAPKIIHCKDCGYYHDKGRFCDLPCEAAVRRLPDDYCSHAVKRIQKEKTK